MVALIAALDTDALLEVVWVSLVSGIGVTAVFSLALLGGTRSGEARRAGESGAAAAFGTLAVIAGIVLVIGVAFGVSVLVG